MLEKILQEYKDPYLGDDYVTLAMANILPQDKGIPSIEITLPYPIARAKSKLEKELKSHFSSHKINKVKISFKQDVARLNPRPRGSLTASPTSPSNQLGQVKNVIAVASGKGGVGKSTMALYLTRSLHKIGAKVGLLDADIYGPSQPHLLQSKADRKQLAGEKDNTMNPVVVDGIKTMSLRYLLDDNQTPAIWRGAMASNALQQMAFSTLWGDLDYLIIDMPPGTGDIQLTLCQRVSLSAAVIVTTPHQLAVIGAEKGVEMFNKLYVPVVGIIENMSYYVCPKCQNKHYIFGVGTTTKLKPMGVDTIGEIPISQDYNQEISGDNIPDYWQDLALNLCASISRLTINSFPTIEVIND